MDKKILSVEKKTENRFLNFYDVHYTNRTGKQKVYYVASRAESVEDLKINTKINRPDGVIIYSVYGEKKDHMVLVRQYRPSINDYVYELPAGLIEKGETCIQAGVRELKEETGLVLEPIQTEEWFHKPFFTTIGLTDESCATVYGYAHGTISLEGLEENEDLEVILADRQEVLRILKEENVSMNCSYFMMHFLHHTEEDPFYFLNTKLDAKYATEQGK